MAEVINGVGKVFTDYINLFRPRYINCFLNI